MKKNVIALAVAAAMAAPLAQAEVTVSGTLQAELVSWSGDNNAEGLYVTDGQTYGSSKGSGVGQLTFSATEDLGNGMKALAKYNFSLTADDAANGVRDSYVGLTGGFGTVLAGRMSTPYKSSTVKWDPFLATFAQARGNAGMTNGVHGNGSYLSNAVAYANKFGPAKVVIAAGIDEAVDAGATPAGSSTTGNHAISAAVNVPVGPVELAIAVHDASDYGANTGATVDRSQTKVGVKYAAGALTVAAQVENSDVAVDDGTFTYLTGSYAMGANTFSASYGTYAADNTAGGANPAWGGNDATYMAVGMKHAFSKATSVHVAYRSTTVDVPAGAAAADESAIGAGLRVNF